MDPSLADEQREAQTLFQGDMEVRARVAGTAIKWTLQRRGEAAAVDEARDLLAKTPPDKRAEFLWFLPVFVKDLLLRGPGDAPLDPERIAESAKAKVMKGGKEGAEALTRAFDAFEVYRGDASARTYVASVLAVLGDDARISLTAHLPDRLRTRESGTAGREAATSGPRTEQGGWLRRLRRRSRSAR